MAIGKQDIALLFGVLGGGSVSGESGQLIKSQLESITATLNNKANTKNRSVALNLDTQATKTLFSTGLKQITDGLSGQKQFKIKISKIDASSAISGVKKQLETMLSALSVSNGVNVTGLKDFLGTEGVDAALKKTAVSADAAVTKMNAAKTQATSWAGQMKVLGTISQSVASTYKSGLSGKNAIGDSGAVNEITAAYGSWQQKVETLRASKTALSSQDVSDLQAEGIAIQRKIANIQEEQTAQATLTAQAEKRSRAEDKASNEAAEGGKKQEVSLKRILELQKQVESYIGKNTRMFGTDSHNELTALQTGLKQIVDSGRQVNSIEFGQLQTQFSKVTGEVKRTGQEGKSLGSIISGAYEKFGGWMLITQSFSAIIRSLKQMVKNVIEVDTAMTELRKVTDETDLAYARFLDGAVVRSKAMGATLADTISATADFARLGLNMSDASALADTALIYKNVGDGISDIGVASESIISTMKAFGIEASSSMEIVDKFNTVGNKFAISSGGVGEALMRSASALAASNNSLDESIALVTAANNVIQDPDKVGTALKTVSMYLRAAKTEAEDAGESTDGMASSISELRNELLSLTGGAVDIQIDEDTFKSTYQIIQELSAVWGDLTDITQANILEMIGGKRNSNVVSALLSNFDTAESVIEAAANSSGSALAENEKHLDSIAGKLTVFQAAFEELSTTIVSSDLVGGIVDFGTGSLETLNRLVEILGSIPVAITAITGAVAVLKANQKGALTTGIFTVGGEYNNQIKTYGASLSELSTRFDIARNSGMGFLQALKASTGNNSAFAGIRIQSYNRQLERSVDVQETFKTYIGKTDEDLSKYIKSLDGSEGSLKGYSEYLKDAGKSMTNLGIKSKGASVAVKMLKVATGMFVSMGISLAIQGVITGIQHLVNAQKEARLVAIDAGQTAVEEAGKLTSLLDSYMALSSAVESNQESREELMSVEGELLAHLGLEGKAVEELETKYGSLTKAIIAAAREQLRTDISVATAGANAAKDTAANSLVGIFDNKRTLSFSYDDGSQEVLEFLQKRGFDGISTMGNSVGNIFLRDAGGTFESVLNNQNKLKDMMNAASNEFGAEHPAVKTLTKFYMNYEKETKAAVVAINAANELIAQGAFYDIEGMYSDKPDTLDKFETLRKHIIQSTANNVNFDDNGGKTAEQLTDEILASDERYSELMGAYKKEQQNISEVTKMRDKIAKKLASPIASDVDEGTVEGTLVADKYIEKLKSFDQQLSSLSEEAFEVAYNAVVNEGAGTWEEITAAIKVYNSEQSKTSRDAERLKGSLKGLWGSEGFAESKKNLVKIASNAGGITSKNIIDLAAESTELSEALKVTGMDAQFLAKVLQTTADGADGFSLITADALGLNAALFDMKEEFDNVTEARSRFDAAMAAPEKDDDFKSYADAFNTLNEEFKAGTTNSNQFWAASEFLFGSDQLQKWGWSEGLDEIYKAMQGNKSIFEDAESAGAGFVDKLYKMSEAGKLVDEAGAPLAEIAKLTDGSYKFDIDVDNIDKVAEKMGLSTEAVTACLKALSMWGDVNFYDMDTVINKIGEIGLSAKTLDGTAINVSALIDQLHSLGKTDKEIYDILQALQEVKGITLLDASADIDILTGSLKNLGLAASDGVTISVNAESLSNLMSSMNFTKEKAEEMISKLGEADGIKLTNAKGEVKTVADMLAHIGTLDFAIVDSNLDGTKQAMEGVNGAKADNATSEMEEIGSAAEVATLKVDGIRLAIDKVDGTTATVIVSTKWKNGILSALFGNTSDATNEPISNGGERSGKSGNPAYRVGTSGAQKGEALTGEDGEELVQSGGRAYLVGTNGPEVVNLNAGDRVYTANETKKIMRGSGRGVSGVIPAYAWGTINTKPNKPNGGGSGDSKSTTVATDNAALEEQLKETLDKLSKEVSDIIGDFEHSIFMSEKYGVSADKIAAIYRNMQKAVANQATTYRKLGLDENSDYIQDLQKQWWGYQEEITQLRQDNFNAELEDSKFTIEALSQDDGNTAQVLESWRRALTAINNEIAYYSAIGYNMSSDVMQSLAKEAWSVEEEIQSVLSGIIEKAGEAIDNIQNSYDTLKEAADEYAKTGYVSVDTLQSIVDLGVEYISFLKNENGQIVINEANIQKMVAAKTEQLAVESALSYIEQLRTATESGKTAEVQKLLSATTATTSATWGLVYANLALLNLSGDQYAQALYNINTLRSIADNTIANIGGAMSDDGDSRSDYYDDAADALDTILDLTMDLIKHEKEQQIDALEGQIDRYREIINLKKESLQTTKDEEDHSKEVAKRIKEVSALQTRIAKLKREGTRESLAEAAGLEEELGEKQEELADYQSDYAFEKQQEALDKEADAFEKTKNDEIKVIEDSISSTEKLYQLAIERIGTDWNGLFDDLKLWNYEYGSTLESELVSAWNAASEAVKEYGSYLDAIKAIDKIQAGGGNVVGTPGNAGGLTNTMRENSLSWWTASNEERSNLDSEQSDLAAQLSTILGGNVTKKDGSWYKADGSVLYSLSQNEVASAIVSAMKANSAQWNNSSPSERAALEQENRTLAARLQGYLDQKIISDSDGVWWMNGKKLYDTYHNGGVVGGNPTLKQNEVMAVLEKEEIVLDKKKEGGLYKIIDFASVLSQRLGKAISSDSFGAAFLGNRSLLPTLGTLPEAGGVTNNTATLNPIININFGSTEGMTDSEAVKLGKIAARSTLAELSNALNSRGVNGKENTPTKNK